MPDRKYNLTPGEFSKTRPMARGYALKKTPYGVLQNSLHHECQFTPRNLSETKTFSTKKLFYLYLFLFNTFKLNKVYKFLFFLYLTQTFPKHFKLQLKLLIIYVSILITYGAEYSFANSYEAICCFSPPLSPSISDS